mmetsp:Transcript_30884/g.97384  ORF Transcript_30884/g.97384 Transcript_30884/m.97384 type:complete len:356 (+) Transcript_30884:556-1623(+)
MVVLLHRGRQVGLAPAAVGQLLGAQKRERLGDVRRSCLPLADRGEADHAKPRAVGEANAPRAIPRTVGPLLVADPLRAELDRRRDLGSAVAGMAAVEVREGGDARAGQLAVRVVDDDVPEALGRVEQLERRGAARVLVGGPAAGAPVLGGVLVRENDVDAIEQPLRLERRYAGQAEGLDSEDALEPFRRAVRDRPAVVLSYDKLQCSRMSCSRTRSVSLVLGREGPRAVRDVAVVPLDLGAVLAHLRRVEVLVRLPQDGRDLGVPAEARRRDGLHCKGRVPRLRPVVALHLHAVLGEPEVVEDAGQVRLEGLPVRVVVPAADHVDRLVDRADVDVPCRSVLVLDHVGAPRQRAAA